MSPHVDVRQSSVSGLFYPADAAELGKQVDGFLAREKSRPEQGRVMGIIAPHAGYMYSGMTAGMAYASIAGASYETVVIISPSHRDFFDGVSVYPGDAYETPLGRVPIDRDLRKAMLEACPILHATPRGHGEEHAVEVHIPFLQKALPSFGLLPLVMGHQTRRTCVDLGEAIARVMRDRNVLLVASSDLSHYHQAAVAERMDGLFVDAVRSFDPDEVMEVIEAGTAEACGGGPIVAMMVALRLMGATRIEVVHHCTSGDITGDRSSVVGYFSAVAWS
jgi:MEMO1 family protein